MYRVLVQVHWFYVLSTSSSTLLLNASVKCDGSCPFRAVILKTITPLFGPWPCHTCGIIWTSCVVFLPTYVIMWTLSVWFSWELVVQRRKSSHYPLFWKLIYVFSHCGHSQRWIPYKPLLSTDNSHPSEVIISRTTTLIPPKLHTGLVLPRR